MVFDWAGIVSATISKKTVRAKSTVTPNDIFSPDSTGR